MTRKTLARGDPHHWNRSSPSRGAAPRVVADKEDLEDAGPVSSRTSDTGGGTHVIEDTRFAKDLSQHHVHVHSACLELVVRKIQARTYSRKSNDPLRHLDR